MNMPTFSVITVCFNALDDLAATHESLKNQTCDDYEWVVIDGASQDGTKGWLESIAGSSLRFVSEKDKGIYDAMNKGISLAQGEYLIFMNAGDCFASAEVLSEVKKLASSSSPDFIYGDSEELLPDGTRLTKPARHSRTKWYGMFAHHQAMFFKRTIIGDIRYEQTYRIGGDYAFVCNVLQKSRTQAKTGACICIFRVGGVSYTHWREGLADQWRIRRDILKMNVAMRLCLASMHFILHTVRRSLPSVYRNLRY